MKCFNCKIEIPQAFTFALSQNECPGCGKEILDEETRALKDDIVKYVGSSITLKPATLDKLSMMLISRYDIQGISGNSFSEVATKTRKELIAEASVEVIEESEQDVLDADEEIRKLQEKRDQDIKNKELDDLKGEALQEAMKERYNISFQGKDKKTSSSMSPTDLGEDDLPPIIRQKMNSPDIPANIPASEVSNVDFGDVNPIIEAERLKRKVKGAQALQGSTEGSFRRT